MQLHNIKFWDDGPNVRARATKNGEIKTFVRAMNRVRRAINRVDDDTVIVTSGPIENVMGDWEDFCAGVNVMGEPLN